jgi:hypothetical protein
MSFLIVIMVCAQVHGVIYVVDAADRERLAESKETLAKALASEGIPNKPILVIANKQDIAGCLSAVEVTEQLGLLQHKDNRYHVAACQAKPANGQAVDSRIGQSLRWLLDSIEAEFPALNARVAKDTEERKAKELVRREEQKKRAEASKAARLREQAESEALEKAAAAAAAAEPAGHPPAQAPAAPPGHSPGARPPEDDTPAGRRPAEMPHADSGAGVLHDGFGRETSRTPPAKRTVDGPPPPGPPAPAPPPPPACRPMEIEPSTTRAAAAPAAWGTPPPAAAAERVRMRALPPLPNAVESPLIAAVRPGGDRPPPRHLSE